MNKLFGLSLLSLLLGFSMVLSIAEKPKPIVRAICDELSEAVVKFGNRQAVVSEDAHKIMDLVIKKFWFNEGCDYFAPSREAARLSIEELSPLLDKYHYLRDLKPAVYAYEKNMRDCRTNEGGVEHIDWSWRLYFAGARFRDVLEEREIPEYQ